MFIGMLQFWGLLIGGGFWLVRELFDKKPRQLTGEARSPREILEQRYARGEITKEQFDEMKRGLEL